MEKERQKRIDALIRKGVRIHCPGSVDVGADVDPGRISGDGVILYPGSRIYGASTLILKGARIGEEGPVTLQDCRIGPGVALGSGFFKGAVFLEGVSMGAGAHVREGTILEEGARGAHTVGLKQTVLFPFVTLGSLINFCDCLMAGGTGREDHSEVGSSFVHFNYTPNGDKATPSLIGDVPRGVLLKEPPIFLGGQGGLVGPTRLEFGTVTASGSICRKDVLKPGRLVFEGTSRGGSLPFERGLYRAVNRILLNNIIYIANLTALGSWYRDVRVQFVSKERFPEALFEGLKETLGLAVEERIRRLRGLAEKMTDSAEKYRNFAGENGSKALLRQKSEMAERWPELEERIRSPEKTVWDGEARDTFLDMIRRGIDRQGKSYLDVIRGLSVSDAATGTRWLQSIVDGIRVRVRDSLSAFKL